MTMRTSIILCAIVCCTNWLIAQTDTTFQSSNLPIVIIRTNGQSISDTKRIMADMGIIQASGQQRNSVTDPWNGYSGKINIEIRGSSSQQFPKKSYGFETQDSLGNNRNVSLLGMPEENDWVLHAPYADKTLLRNEIPYYLSRAIGRYATRTVYCELVLNGIYQGIYVLMEKVKQDKNRVNISSLDPSDTAGVDLTGGYIIKMDKPNGLEWQVGVNSLYGFDKSLYEYHDPDDDVIMPQQRLYIRRYMASVESSLVSGNFTDTVNGYAKYLDVPSFVDHLLLSEFTKNLDSYRFSFFLHKEKDSKGGKLFAGPMWDYDLAFANYGENAWEQPWLTSAWNANIAAWHRSYWMKRLLNDPNFVQKARTRWIQIRHGVLSNDSLMSFMDSTMKRIEEARIRNFQRWPIIGVKVWPNYYVGATYEQDVAFLKSWITGRLQWIDVELTGGPVTENTERPVTAHTFDLEQNFPNPFNPTTQIRYRVPAAGRVTLRIYDLLGRTVVTLVDQEQPAGEYTVRWNASSNAAGMYIYRMEAGERNSARTMLLLK